MSEDQDDAQKTEEPTQKKLEDSRKKGQVPMSREVNHWIVLFAATMVIVGFGPNMMSELSRIFASILEQAPAISVTPTGMSRFVLALASDVVAALWLPIMFLMLAGLIGPLGQVGLMISPESIKPSLSKISLIKGLKRMFSMRSLMEFLKGVLKLVIIGTVGFLILRPFYDGVDHLIGLPVIVIAEEMRYLLTKVMVAILMVLIVVAVIDLVYQRMEHMKKMRMTREEVKDEYKQAEGDPHVKGKLRQLRTQRARQRMMQSVPEADVVITNPTHFACALKYDPDQMDAPVLIAKGADNIAAKIREKANENKIMIVENKPLARALYRDVEVDESIPPEHYQAVAEVISYVFGLKGKL